MSIFDLTDSLIERDILENRITFHIAAAISGYNEHMEPGIYVLEKKWNNWGVIGAFYHQDHKVARVDIRGYRSRYQLTKGVCKNLAISGDTLYKFIQSPSFLGGRGFNEENVWCLFIQNAFIVPENISVGHLADKLQYEYEHFWTDKRLAKTEQTGLNRKEVTILGSVVYAETKYEREMPVIAGLYINRLNKGIRLQADPTVVFASNHSGVQRVSRKDTEIDSPYNTYNRKGLPPGPVYSPSATAVQAVLNFEEHDYLYFCADDNFSGRHVFAETYKAHKKNARKYRRALNRRNIY